MLFILQANNPIPNGLTRDLPILLDILNVVLPILLSVGTVAFWCSSDKRKDRFHQHETQNQNNSPVDYLSFEDRVHQSKDFSSPDIELDPLFFDAVDHVYQSGIPSAREIQKNLRIGYLRATAILDQMETIGIVSPIDGAKPRNILLNEQQWRTILPRLHNQVSEPQSHNDAHKERQYCSTPAVTPGHISCLSGQEMVMISRNYHVVEEIRTKVRGVKFRNDNGTDRQTILRHCHAGDQLRFSFYRYQGAPAYTVVSDWGQIGNLSADLAEELAEMISSRKNKCLILGEILNISGGYRGESFGCNISLTIYEKNY